jgi:cell wall-associated NlpC family hydrolase
MRYSDCNSMNSPLPAFAALCALARWAAICLCAAALVACGSTPSARPEAREQPEVIGKLTPGQAQDVTLYAMNLVGTPYRYGGNTPEGGFDCSGLIGHVYQTNGGLVPPRTTAKLQSWGKPVPTEQMRMGDLVVFLKGDTANHAGIYVGNNRFVHAPSTGGVVRLDSLNSKYWSTQPMVVRRP